MLGAMRAEMQGSRSKSTHVLYSPSEEIQSCVGRQNSVRNSGTQLMVRARLFVLALGYAHFTRRLGQ